MASWPLTLPQYIDQDGYQEKLPKLFIRTAMEAGIPKRRRRFSSSVRPIQGQMLLTFAEMQIFEDFYMNDLAGGSQTFDWVHPRTQAPCVMGFTSEPSVSAQGAAFILSMELEVMP